MEITRYKGSSRYTSLGMLLSAIAHAFVFFLFFANSFRQEKIPPNVIYSVTIDSGNKKGGVGQIPDKNSTDKVSPHKKVQEKKKETEKPKEAETKKKEVKKEEKTVKPEEAEVVLPSEKEEEKKIEKEVVKKKPIEKPKPKKKTETSPKSKDKKNEAEKPVKTSKKESSKVSKKKADPVQDINKSYQEALQRYKGASTNAGGKGFGSTGTGGRGFGGGVVKSPEWFRYKYLLENTIKRGWNWHDSSRDLVASVSFKISPDGVLSSVRLTKSSGNPLYDDSIMRAVSKASPVPPAPEHLYSDFKFVELDFSPE